MKMMRVKKEITMQKIMRITNTMQTVVLVTRSWTRSLGSRKSENR